MVEHDGIRNVIRPDPVQVRRNYSTIWGGTAVPFGTIGDCVIFCARHPRQEKILLPRLRQQLQECAIWQTINHKRIVIAPFDIVGDTMRGTKVVMLDMYQIPNKVAAAFETVTAVVIQMATLDVRGWPQPEKWSFLNFDG